MMMMMMMKSALDFMLSELSTSVTHTCKDFKFYSLFLPLLIVKTSSTAFHPRKQLYFYNPLASFYSLNIISLFIMIITHFQGWKRRKTHKIRMKEMTNKGIYKIMQSEIDLPSKIIFSFISSFRWQSLFLNDQQLFHLLFSFLWCHQRKECLLQQQISLWHVIC